MTLPMGLLALPTMLRNNYSPELATGVIAASGTLGQIIPPSIVIVLLGTLAGDLYSAAQESRAQLAGCTDALTYLGEPAVLSVGTLFQAALIPGILLAFLYGLYAFGYALFNPSKAPAVELGSTNSEVITRNEALTWFLGAPVALIFGLILLSGAGLIGNTRIGIVIQESFGVVAEFLSAAGGAEIVGVAVVFDGRGGVLFSDRHAADGIAMFRRCHWLMDISDRGWRKDHRSHDRGSDAVADGSSSSRDSCMAGHWFSDAATDPRRSTALAICGRGAEG